MSEPTISLVVAHARDGVIGDGGDMPWQIVSDLRRFKSVTLGKPVIMGRKTFESIGRALPGRHTIVLTRDENWFAPKVDVVHSFADAVGSGRDWATTHGAREIVVAGGGEIYRLALPHADLVRATEVDAEPGGDTTFGPLPEHEWTVMAALDRPMGERDEFATRYRVWRRR